MTALNLPPAHLQETGWDWRREPGKEEGRRLRAKRDARRRGLLQGAVGLVVAGLFGLVFHRVRWAEVVAGVACLVILATLFSPLGLLRVFNRWVEALGRWIGAGVTWILMPVVYYTLFWPLGLLLRAGGKLGITTRPDPRLTSYWTSTASAAGGPRRPDSYRRQF